MEQITEGGITYEVMTNSDGGKWWYLNGKCHRIDGPAVEYADGTKAWFLNGERHRTNGPAIERAGGTKSWYLNGKRHRVDGPAVEYANGSKWWYLNGKKLTEEEFKEYRKQMKHLMQHPEDAPLYLNHKYLNFIAKEILDGTDH